MNRSDLCRDLFRKHGDTLLAALLAVMVFSIYLWTLCPTLYWGDCAELATVAVTLGIPHPTGYPLYCLLGHAWTLLLPVGTLVWRLNVLSALLGSLAIACLYGCARMAALPRPLALMAGGLLAFTSTFWQQCIITETYTLAAFFTCLLLFLATRWKARGCRPTDLRLLALAYGFTLTSHQTNTLFLPGFLAFVLWSAPAMRRLGDRATRVVWAKTLGLGALPLLIYAYLPLRARMHPAYNWGDIETPFAFFYHVTGRIFLQRGFHDPPSWVELHFLSWVEKMPMQFSWPLVALCALGLGLFWRQRGERPLALLLTWIILADIAFATTYSIYNAYIYYIPCYAAMSLCAGRSLLGLWRALEPRVEEGKRPAYAAFGALCALALIPVQAAGHAAVSLRGNWTCYDYSRNLLASVPPHGLLIEDCDDTAAFGVTYLQLVEGRRPDVTLIRRGMLSVIYDPHYQTFANVWYLHDLKRRYPRLNALYPSQGIEAMQALAEDPLRRIIRDAIARRAPVCILAPAGAPIWFKTPLVTDDNGDRVRMDTYLDRHYATATIGLVTRVFPAGEKPPATALCAETERVWRSYSLRGVFDGGLQRDPYLALLALNYGNGSLVRANLAYSQDDYTAAEASYTDVLSLFTCDEATQGLERCALAQRRAGHVLSARNNPTLPTTEEASR